MSKKERRMRRSVRTRMKIRRQEALRLCVHRTSMHMYAQIISADGSKVLVCASTVEKELRSKMKSTSNVDAAKLVGSLIAKRAKEAGITRVAFDRSGYDFHGRVKALADAAREGGLF